MSPRAGPEPQERSLGVRLARSGASALIVVSMMIVGSLVMWVGIPMAWLWVGSQIQAETDNLGLAIGAMMIGVLVSVIAGARVLVSLNHGYEALRESRGQPQTEHSLLEMVLVITAGVAVVIFGIWFFIFTGPGPSLAPSN